MEEKYYTTSEAAAVLGVSAHYFKGVRTVLRIQPVETLKGNMYPQQAILAAMAAVSQLSSIAAPPTAFEHPVPTLTIARRIDSTDERLTGMWRSRLYKHLKSINYPAAKFGCVVAVEAADVDWVVAGLLKKWHRPAPAMVVIMEGLGAPAVQTQPTKPVLLAAAPVVAAVHLAGDGLIEMARGGTESPLAKPESCSIGVTRSGASQYQLAVAIGLGTIERLGWRVGDRVGIRRAADYSRFTLRPEVAPQGHTLAARGAVASFRVTWCGPICDEVRGSREVAHSISAAGCLELGGFAIPRVTL